MEAILIRIAIVVALLAGSALGGYSHGRSVEHAKQVAADDEQRQRVMRTEHVQSDRAMEADHVQEVKRQRQAVADAAVRSELDRLRELTAQRDLPGAAADPGFAAYAATADGLLAECAGEYSSVAHDAGDSAGRLGGLQDLVRPNPVKDPK